MEPKEKYHLQWDYSTAGQHVYFQIFYILGAEDLNDEQKKTLLLEEPPTIPSHLANVITETGMSYVFFIPEDMNGQQLNDWVTFGVRTVSLENELFSDLAMVTEFLDTRPRPQMAINLKVVIP